MQSWKNAVHYISGFFFAPAKWNDKNYFLLCLKMIWTYTKTKLIYFYVDMFFLIYSHLQT